MGIIFKPRKISSFQNGGTIPVYASFRLRDTDIIPRNSQSLLKAYASTVQPSTGSATGTAKKTKPGKYEGGEYIKGYLPDAKVYNELINEKIKKSFERQSYTGNLDPNDPINIAEMEEINYLAADAQNKYDYSQKAYERAVANTDVANQVFYNNGLTVVQTKTGDVKFVDISNKDKYNELMSDNTNRLLTNREILTLRGENENFSVALDYINTLKGDTQATRNTLSDDILLSISGALSAEEARAQVESFFSGVGSSSDSESKEGADGVQTVSKSHEDNVRNMNNAVENAFRNINGDIALKNAIMSNILTKQGSLEDPQTALRNYLLDWAAPKYNVKRTEEIRNNVKEEKPVRGYDDKGNPVTDPNQPINIHMSEVVEGNANGSYTFSVNAFAEPDNKSETAGVSSLARGVELRSKGVLGTLITNGNAKQIDDKARNLINIAAFSDVLGRQGSVYYYLKDVTARLGKNLSKEEQDKLTKQITSVATGNMTLFTAKARNDLRSYPVNSDLLSTKNMATKEHDKGRDLINISSAITLGGFQVSSLTKDSQTPITSAGNTIKLQKAPSLVDMPVITIGAAARPVKLKAAGNNEKTVTISPKRPLNTVDEAALFGVYLKAVEILDERYGSNTSQAGKDAYAKEIQYLTNQLHAKLCTINKVPAGTTIHIGMERVLVSTVAVPVKNYAELEGSSLYGIRTTQGGRFIPAKNDADEEDDIDPAMFEFDVISFLPEPAVLQALTSGNVKEKAIPAWIKAEAQGMIHKNGLSPEEIFKFSTIFK